MMLAEEMAVYAASKGLGTYDPDGDTGNIYIGILPDTPNDLLSLFPRGGPPRDPLDEYIIATMQFIVRSKSKLNGLIKGQEVIDAFHAFSHGSFTPNGFYVVDCLSQVGEPADIGKDGSDRYEWSINLSVEYHNNKEVTP